MDKVLVIYTDTINDTDIEITGFKIMTINEYDEYERLTEKITWPFTYEIGEFEISFTSGDDLMSRLEVRDIYVEEEKMLKKLFTGYGNEFGFFISDTFLKDLFGDEEEDDIEDEEEYDDDYDDDKYDSRFYDDDDDDEY